ncbi:hypothetical protein R3W88_033052 [Solanum pinnatisectum]|uniref:Uncharacterized protein n=1 Tax=Solanum pinnatisectum TaxID=50273 RepID=A0AAV9K2N8_9SOLN|nr:hypothetical protein R3W88_033052 [Solanum pinnatisectum]
MPNTRSKGAPLIPYNPELRKTICKMVNTHELEAQRQRLGLDAETTARGAQQNAVNDPPRVVGEQVEVEEIVPPQHQPIATRGRAPQQPHIVLEEDDLDLDGVEANQAIVLPVLPPGVKFTITITIIQLLNLKGMFRGATSDDANEHLMNFVAICKS